MPKLDQATCDKLLQAAIDVAEQSYSPYSKFPVGAALLGADGRVFTGCNVECSTWDGTCCAERAALVKAVSEGCRQFRAVAVVCKRAKNCWPCGICRQFLAEFGLDLDVIVQSDNGSPKVISLSELLPHAFGPKSLPG
jgi:cytidine deaminase